jgi:hypothetical protein
MCGDWIEEGGRLHPPWAGAKDHGLIWIDAATLVNCDLYRNMHTIYACISHSAMLLGNFNCSFMQNNVYYFNNLFVQ